MGSIGKHTHAELNNVLLCKVCMNHYDASSRCPKLLPCDHSFCQDCLTKYLFKTKKKISTVFCPLCEKKFDIKGGEELIPKDFKSIDMLVTRTPLQYTERQSEIQKEHDQIWGDATAEKYNVDKLAHQPLHPPTNWDPPILTPTPDSTALLSSLEHVNHSMMNTGNAGSHAHESPADSKHASHASFGEPTVDRLEQEHQAHQAVPNVDKTSTLNGKTFLLNGFLQVDDETHDTLSSLRVKSPQSDYTSIHNLSNNSGGGGSGRSNNFDTMRSGTGSGLARNLSSPDEENDWNYFSKATIGRNASDAANFTQFMDKSPKPAPITPPKLTPATPTHSQIFDQNAVLKLSFSPLDKLAITEKGKLVVSVFGNDGRLWKSFSASNGRDSCFIDDKMFAIAVNEGIEMYDVETGKFVSLIPVQKPTAVAAVKGGFVTTIGNNLSMCLLINGKLTPFSVACAKNVDGTFHFFKNVRDLATARANPDLIAILDDEGIIFTRQSGIIISNFSSQFLKSVGVSKVESMELSSLGNILLVLDGPTNQIHGFEITQSPPKHVILNIESPSNPIMSFAINSKNQVFIASRDFHGPSIKMYALGGASAGPVADASIAVSRTPHFHNQLDQGLHMRPNFVGAEEKKSCGCSGNGDEELRDKLNSSSLSLADGRKHKLVSGIAPEVYIEARQVDHLEAAPPPRLNYVETIRPDLRSAVKVKVAPQNRFLVIDPDGTSARIVSHEGREVTTFKNDHVVDACFTKNELVVAKKDAIDFHSLVDATVSRQSPFDHPIGVWTYGDGFITSDGKKLMLCKKIEEKLDVNIISRVTTETGQALLFKQIVDISTTAAKPDRIAMLGQGGIVILNDKAQVNTILFNDKLKEEGIDQLVKIHFSIDGNHLFMMDATKKIFMLDLTRTDKRFTHLPLDGQANDAKTFFVNEENQVCLICAEEKENVIKVFDMDSLFI